MRRSRLLETGEQDKDIDPSERSSEARGNSAPPPPSLVLNGQEVVWDPGVGGLPDPGQPQVPQASFQAALPCAEGDSGSLNCKIIKKRKNAPAVELCPTSASSN